MFVNMATEDIRAYNLPELIHPVLWSYAEDLDIYLPFTSWLALKPFHHVWGASVYKGADGPQRYFSVSTRLLASRRRPPATFVRILFDARANLQNPMHYIKNHESWVTQFGRAYSEMESIEVRTGGDDVRNAFFASKPHVFRASFIVAGRVTTILRHSASSCRSQFRSSQCAPRRCSTRGLWTSTTRRRARGLAAMRQRKKWATRQAARFQARGCVFLTPHSPPIARSPVCSFTRL